MKEGSYSGAPSVTAVRVAMAAEIRRHSRVRLMAILTRCQCEASIHRTSPLSPLISPHLPQCLFGMRISTQTNSEFPSSGWETVCYLRSGRQTTENQLN